MASFDEQLEAFRRRDPRTLVRGSSTVNRSGPILRGRPGAIRALARKQADPEYQQVLNRLDPNVVRTIARMDEQRIGRGQMPLTAEEVVRGGAAATTRRQVTPAENRGSSILDIPGNVVADLGQIVKSLPQLPQAIAGEVTDILDGFDDDRRELAEQGRTGLAAFLSLPGVRMIPTTYALSNVAAGDFDEIVKHPLLHALDVLPVASKAAAATPVAKAAETARLADIARGSSTAGRARPIKAVLTRRLTDTGELVPNRLGDIIERVAETAPMRAVSDNFSRLSREGIRKLALQEQEALARTAHPGADDVIGRTAHDWARLASSDEALMETYGITRARETELTRMMGEDPRALAGLPENEARYVADVRARADQMAEYIANTTGELVNIRGEWFTRKDATRLTRAFERMSRAMGKLYGSGEWRTVTRRRSGRTVQERVLDQGIMGDIERLAEVDGRWAQVRDMLDADDVAGASRRVNQLKRYGGQAAGINDQRMVAIRRTINEANQARRTYEALRARVNPARFDELINRRAADAYINQLLERGVIESAEDAARLFDEGVPMAIPGFDRAEFAKLRRSFQRTWEQMKAAGEDPVFMSRVAPSEVSRITSIKLDGTTPALKTVRARVSDVTPSARSASLSVTKQAFDIIRHEAGLAAGREVLAEFGRTIDDLHRELLPLAEQRAMHDPRLTVGGALEELISRRWTPFDPDSMMPFAGGMGALGSDRIYIPRQVASVLQQAKREGFSKLRALNDPVTRTWRVGVLALAPRWHLYNIIGGAVMTMAETGPQAFRHMKLARDITKAVRDGAELPREIPRELQRTLGLMGREEAELALKRGGTMRRLVDEQSLAGRTSKFFRERIEDSFRLNSFFDDLYRVTSYLEGEASALKGYRKLGFSEEQARVMAMEAGVQTSRKILQDVASMTPLERSVLRQIFPFYSWLSHLMRFAFHFPYDHPWRAALVAGGSRIVMDDFGDAASIDMLDIVSWGEPDERGERRAISMRGLNPFSDTANLFTLAGWLGSTNPLFQTALEAVGFDPQQGGIDLYPSLRYSAETGGLAVDTGNPIRNLVLNSVPHAAALAMHFGLDQDFADLRAQDPETAQRVLMSQVGLPGSYRRYSRERDYIQAELARGRSRDNTVAESLRTGNLDALSPFLTPEQIEGLKRLRASGALDDYLMQEAS